MTRQRQKISEFKASLVYKSSSRIAQAYTEKPYLEKPKPTNQPTKQTNKQTRNQELGKKDMNTVVHNCHFSTLGVEARMWN